LALPFKITVIESVQELRTLQRKHGEQIKKRLQVLIKIKKHQQNGGISKRALSEITGIIHNSIVIKNKKKKN